MLVVKHNLPALEHTDFVDIDNIRTMNAEEMLGWQCALQTSHGHQAEYRLGCVDQVDFYIIFQSLNVENIGKTDAKNFVIALHEDVILHFILLLL